MKITKYNTICNLGSNIDEVFENAIKGNSENFVMQNGRRLAAVDVKLPEIKNSDYDLRCNRMILACLESLKIEELDKSTTAVVCATTNSGVEEYESSSNIKHFQIGNPAEFVQNYYGFTNYYTSVSTACSSGIKAFSIAQDLLKSDYAEKVLVIGVDSLAKVPIYGFDSLEILSPNSSIPFSKNRCGINIGEGVAAFVVEKEGEGIEIAGIGETTDFYHSTTPDPDGVEAERAIRLALGDLKSVDYINLHGTGTIANDLMEGRAVANVFGADVPASSTKPLTGHCLGAAAAIEVALCCKLLDAHSEKVFPHVYDGEYDDKIPQIQLADVNTRVENIKTCLCTSFGFGGTNTAIVLRSDYV